MTTRYTGALTGLLLLTTAAQAQPPHIGPAPDGPPRAVASAALRAAAHPCARLLEALRLRDGSIRALCANGAAYETYRIFTIQGEPVAMKCSAAVRLGMSGC